MSAVLIVLAAWLALDAALFVCWLGMSARKRRLQARTMVRAGEGYATLTRPQPGQLSSR